ncbi:hypothetical protein ACQP00_15110 [Dactylosporangium sp. CS-047395]|uniref:hypothetical protein n=1 Tax=Dactylosporangium sp. CS-047395 TaxID=3239936 RepID=UPI003D8D5C90
MTGPIEELVRRAQHERAEAAAPDLERIRAALPVLSRRRARRRRAGFVAAAFVAVLGVAGIAALPGGTREGQAPAGPPSARTPEVRVAMPYELEQPPDGYRERLRTIEEGPGGVIATRSYSVTPGGPHITLTVRPGGLPNGEPVDVGAVRGVYEEPARVTWPARLGGVVSLDAVGTGLGRAAVVQLAASVADHSLWLDKPLMVDWAPDVRYTMSLIDQDRWATTVVADGSARGRGTLTATLAPTPESEPGGEIVSLHGRPAALFAEDGGLRVVQKLPYTDLALTVTVRPAPDREVLLDAAAEVDVRL